MLRGIFDGGGLRKQNGHWQSSRAGVIPPTPVAMLTEGILYIVGGERIFTDGGTLNPLNMSTPYSVIVHNGKPFFNPHDQGTPYWWEIDKFDPAINVAGSVYASSYDDIHPYTHDGEDLRYVNTVINYSFERYFQDGSPEVIAYNNYIAEHGSATMHIRFKPNPDDPVYMQEMEQNLCLGKYGELVSSYCAVPAHTINGKKYTFCQFYIEDEVNVDETYILGSPEPVLLNATNGANLPANTTPIEYLHGFRIGRGLELVSTNANPYPRNSLSINVWRGYFSFPFDYQNNVDAPYLSLKVEVFYD